MVETSEISSVIESSDTIFSEVEYFSALSLADENEVASVASSCETALPIFIQSSISHGQVKESGWYVERFYVGFKSQEEAENMGLGCTEFKLYKRLDISTEALANEVGNGLPEIAPLTIVYRKSNGEYVHFPISQVKVEGCKNSTRYFVQHGGDSAVLHQFPSINKLLSFYSQTAILHNDDPRSFPNKASIEVFPVNGVKEELSKCEDSDTD